MISGKLDFAAGQIDGKREYQEDVYKVVLNQAEPQHFVALLADGMGGHAAGDIAALTAVNAFIESIDTGEKPFHTQFMQCLDQANRALTKAVEHNQKYKGMGCTLVGIEIVNSQCHWISVGDSPLFHISNGKIKRINADHSMAAQLDAAAKMGEISKEEALNSSSRNVLLSALTGERIDRVDYSRHPQNLKKGDWLILASDGVETLQPNEILELVTKTTDQTASNIYNTLMKAIIKRDKRGQDNASAVVIQIHETDNNIELEDDEVTTRPIIR